MSGSWWSQWLQRSLDLVITGKTGKMLMVTSRLWIQNFLFSSQFDPLQNWKNFRDFLNYTIQIAQNHIKNPLAIPQLGFAEGDVAICSIAFSSWLLHHLGNLVDFVSSAWEFIPSKFELCSEFGPENGQTQCIHVSYTLYIFLLYIYIYYIYINYV